MLTIVGGVLLQTFNGTLFLWASISQYVLSYLYKYQKDLDQNQIFYCDMLLIAMNCVGYQIGTYFLNTKRLNPRLIIFIFGSFALAGIFLSTYQTNYYAFIFFYAGCSGIG